MSTSQLIKTHDKYIKKFFGKDKKFSEAHKEALRTLKHERLIHLIVTIAVTVFCIIFFALYLFFAVVFLLVIFVILLILTLAYYFYYYKLENTVIKWEELEYKITKKS